MVGADEHRLLISSPMDAVVSEHEVGSPGNQTAVFQNAKVDIEGDAAKCHHDAEARQQIQFAFEPWPAVAKFLGRRLVAWRGTVRSGRDSGIDKPQTESRPLRTVP